MARTFTTIAAATAVAEIKAALQAKSLITSVLYESTSDIVFTTPLTSKVIKIHTTTNFAMYFGDAWTSGTTITNQTYIAYQNSNTILNFYMVADTDFFVIIVNVGGSNNALGYLGKFDNNDSLAAGMTNNGGGNNRSYNLTTGVQLCPVGLSTNANIVDASLNILTYDLLWKRIDTNIIEANGLIPLKISKLKGICKLDLTNLVIGSNYIIFNSGIYCYTTSGGLGCAFPTSVVIEFDA